METRTLQLEEVHNIVKIILKDPELVQNQRRFFNLLELPPGEFYEVHTRARHSGSESYEFYSITLIKWITINGTQAKLDDLINKLRVEQFVAVADELNKYLLQSDGIGRNSDVKTEQSVRLELSTGFTNENDSSDTIIQVNIFWVNGYADQQFLQLSFEGICPLSKFRNELKEMILEKTKLTGREPSRLQMGLIMEDGYHLSDQENYLALRDLDYINRHHGVLNMIMQTRYCGLATVEFVQSDETKQKLFTKFDVREITVDTLKDFLYENIKNVDRLSHFFVLDSHRYIRPGDESLLRDVLEPYYNKVEFCLKTRTNLRRILVKIENETPITLDVGDETFIDELQTAIRQKLGTSPTALLRLSFNGTNLSGNNQLFNYNIENEATLDLNYVYYSTLKSNIHSEEYNDCDEEPEPGYGYGDGYCYRPVQFADISKSKNLVVKQFTRSAPNWRVVRDGVNIEGICGDSNCIAYRSQVIAPMGLTDFHLMYSKVSCPICHNEVSCVLTCGFSFSFWKFFGRKQMNESKLLFADWRESGNAYTTFDVNTDGGGLKGLESWSLLVIQARGKFVTEAGSFLCPTHCAICFQEFRIVDGEKVTRLSCGHIYHKICADRAVGQSNCNMCLCYAETSRCLE